MPYAPPPVRREDFRDQYLRKRRANLGTVTSVDTPYGENLASLDWKGDPIAARSGDSGGNILNVAMDQLGQDNAPPYSSPIPVVSPMGQVSYTRQPFSPLTGQTNYVPGGTVSSTIPPPVAMNGVPQVEGQGEIGEPIVQQANPSADAYLTPVQQIQANQNRMSHAFLDPNSPEAQDPAYQQWVQDQNDQRALPLQPNGLPKQPLGPMEGALAQLTQDNQDQEAARVGAEQLKNSLMREDRLTRQSQGRRGADGRLVPTRTSGVSPAYAAERDKQARELMSNIQNGSSPDVIAQQYDRLVRGSAAGAPVPMTVQQLSQQQNAADSQQRTRLYQQEADRRAKEDEQRQADRIQLQEGLTKFANAKDDAERQKVIRDYPQILGNSAGRALERTDAGQDVSRVDFNGYSYEYNRLKKEPETPENLRRMAQLQALMDRHLNEQSAKRGIQIPSAVITPPTTINPAIPYQAVQYLKDHPDTVSHFDQIFGAGAAKKVLGQ